MLQNHFSAMADKSCGGGEAHSAVLHGKYELGRVLGHIFRTTDINMIRARLGELEGKFGCKPIVVITEKDYDRDPVILKQIYPLRVFVLCSTLKVLPYRGSTEDSFKKFLKDQLKMEFPAEN